LKKSLGILLLITTLLGGLVLNGCQSKESSETVLKIGASPVPHAQILEKIKPSLEAQGIKLEIVEFTDYVTPNLALSDEQIDANFFQHLPYLEGFSAERNLELVSLGQIHVEPLGLYSDTLNSVDELKKGSVVAIPNDATNGGRALILLESNGLIKLSEEAGLEATEADIVENPKGLVFEPLEAAQLPRVLSDVDVAIINGNFAIEAGLVPTKDALLLESADSPYANIVAVRKGEENNKTFKSLLEALQSEEVKEFIENEFGGGVVPAF